MADMSDLSKFTPKLPPEQQAIRANCFHPTGTFVEFHSLGNARQREKPMAQKQLLMFFCSLSFFAVLGIHASLACAQSEYRLKAGGFGVDAVTSWPVYIAQEKGFLAKEGIDADFARSYNQMMALIAGSFDVIADGVSTTTLALEKGADVVIVYDLSHRPSEFLVLGRNIRNLSDLEEKTIAIGKIGTVPHLFLKKYLTENGLNVSRIKFRVTDGSQERFAALQAEQISATLLSNVYAFRAQQAGMQLFTLAKNRAFPWTYVVARKQWTKANSEILVRFVRSVHKATLWLYDPTNFTEAVAALTRLTRLDEKTVTWSLKSSIENRVHNFQRPNEKALQSAVNWLLAEGMFSKPFDATAAIDARFYELAVK